MYFQIFLFQKKKKQYFRKKKDSRTSKTPKDYDLITMQSKLYSLLQEISEALILKLKVTHLNVEISSIEVEDGHRHRLQ